MKHTDFYKLHKQLDQQAREELTAAVKAHGGEYVFIHEDEDGDFNSEEQFEAPIICGSSKWMDGYEDFFVTRVVLEDGGYLAIYGYLKDSGYDEYEITSVAHGHLEYIIDLIPETEEVQDVSIPFNNEEFPKNP